MKKLTNFAKTIFFTIFLVTTAMLSPVASGGIYLVDVTDMYSVTLSAPASKPSQPPVNAFDNRLGGNKWFEEPFATPPTLDITFDSGAQLIQAYTITTGNDIPNRQPKEWILSGWDGTGWVELDHRTDVAQRGDNSKATYYILDNQTAYEKYQIDFLDNHGDANFQIGEIELCRILQGQDVTDYFKPTITSANEVAYGHEFDKLFDNSIGENNKAGVIPVPTAANPWTMTFTFPDGVSPNIIGYRIASGTDWDNRDPAMWSMHAGANTNGAVLSALEKRTAFFDRNAWLNFETTPGRQNSLTWNITDSYDAPAAEMGQVGELEILEKVHIDRTNTNYMDVIASVQVSKEKASEPGRNILNNNPLGDKWYSEGSVGEAPNWLSLELAGNPVISRYSLTAVNENNQTGRNPRDWELQAWDDNTGLWETLHKVSGIDFTSQATQYFDFDNSTGYSKYRLYINATENSGVDTQLFNFNLYEATDLYQVSHLPDMVKISSAQGYTGGGQTPEMLIDGNTNTKWYHIDSPTDTASHEIIFEFDQAFAVQEYSFTTANDDEDRDPVDWVFYGSHDGTLWEALDIVDDMAFPDARHEAYNFLVDNDTAYDFYKFEFLASESTLNGYHNGGLQLAEIGLWAPLGQSSSGGAVPEPATWFMLLAGAAGLMWLKRHRLYQPQA